MENVWLKWVYNKTIRGGVLDNYLYRAKDNGPGNGCIKTIVNPRRVYKYQHCHFPTYLYGTYSVDEHGKRVDAWCNMDCELHKLRLNHYFTKSKEEWIKRRSLGKADSKDLNNIRTIDEFVQHDNNDIYDDEMLYYVQKMRKLKI